MKNNTQQGYQRGDKHSTAGHVGINACGERVSPSSEGDARRSKNPLALAMGSVIKIPEGSYCVYADYSTCLFAKARKKTETADRWRCLKNQAWLDGVFIPKKCGACYAETGGKYQSVFTVRGKDA